MPATVEARLDLKPGMLFTMEAVRHARTGDTLVAARCSAPGCEWRTGWVPTLGAAADDMRIHLFLHHSG